VSTPKDDGDTGGFSLLRNFHGLVVASRVAAYADEIVVGTVEGLVGCDVEVNNSDVMTVLSEDGGHARESQGREVYADVLIGAAEFGVYEKDSHGCTL